MLEIRLNCENCKKPLPPHSDEAMICSYECTWCSQCNEEILKNVCPNCGGGLEKRPVRPHQQLDKNPPKGEEVYQPINLEKFIPFRDSLKDILSKER